MIVIFVFMLGIAQHVGLTLTNLLLSLLSITTNLIYTTSGFSLLSPITLSLPLHTFPFIISVN